MATLYYVVYPSTEAAPSGAQVASGLSWAPAVAAGNDTARTDTGSQVFPEVTGLAGGSYRAAFVWHDGADYSNVAVSDAVVIAAETAAGEFSAASLTAPSGASTASTTASGPVAALSLSAPTGTSSTFVSVTATGTISALTVAAPAAAAATVSVASGALDALALTAPNGASAAASEITASGGFAPLSLGALVGSTAVISSVTGAFAQILLTAPIGNSSTVVEVSAAGQISALTFAAPFGNTAVFALPVGAFVEISLSAPSAISGTGSLEELVYQLLANRQELDPVLGEFLVYDTDGVTVKWRARAWEDAEATQPYRGGALRRIDKLELL